MKFVRPRCYFDVELSDIPLGRIVFELYSDICPITCENFRALCTGEKGIGKNTGKNLHYLNIVFHRVVKGFMIQSGDFSVGNGTGGESIYGGTFEDENFELKHDEPFLLSMANRGKDTNGSQFFITTQPAPHLDGIHVVFGHVVSGQGVVTHIENLPVDKVNRPLQDVRVVRCNELVLKSKLKAKEKRKTSASSGSEEKDSEDKEDGEQSDSDQEEKRKKKKKKKQKRKKKRSRKHSGSDSEEDGAPTDTDEEKGPVNPITGTVCKINPADIPDVPANKFLYRGGREDKRGREEKGRGDKERGRRKRENIRGYTKSGRVIKGRGVFRYRTPSRSRSRSFTPPHWKQAETRTIKLSEFQKLEQEKQAKEEEIRRREEARRKRHEEREKEGGEKKGNEEEDKGEEEEGAGGESSKPQRLRRTRVDIQNRLGPRVEKKAEETGPVDYNALDYDDEMEPEDTPRGDNGKVLSVNSKRSDVIVANMFSTLEKIALHIGDETSGDDKENTRDSRKRRGRSSKSRSRSRDKGKERLSPTRGHKRDKGKKDSDRDSRRRSDREHKEERKQKEDRREDKEEKSNKLDKEDKGGKKEEKTLVAHDGELFPDKEAVFSATQAAKLDNSKSKNQDSDKSHENGEKTRDGAEKDRKDLAAIGDKSAKGSGKSRDKFKTTRRRSSSSSPSPRKRSRNRRSRERRRSRTPRRRHRRRSSSSRESRRRRSRSRDRRRKSDKRDKSLEKQSVDVDSAKRSEEAKRKLTARLKELEKEREARGKDKSSSDSLSSSDSD